MGRLGFILALFALVGCKTTDDFIGSGPLQLSETVTRYYREDYLKKPGPQEFIVSRDGRWAGYVHCSNGIGGCQGGTIVFSALHQCEQASGTSCHILDEWGSVVWKGLVTFADGATVGTPAPESDKAVCNLALRYRGNEPAWDTEKYGDYVREAQKRGHTVESCFRLVFGDGPPVPNAVGVYPSPAAAKAAQRAGAMRSPSVEVCRKAVVYKGSQPHWSPHSTFSPFVDEARSRRLTTEACARTVLDAMPDRELCQQAVSYEGDHPFWSSRGFESVVREARRRGLSPQTCHRLVFGEEPPAETREPRGHTNAEPDKRIVYTGRIVHTPMPPPPEPRELDNPKLCQMSIFRRNGTPVWREARSAQKHIEEAGRRGLTLAACDRLVAG